MTPLTVGGVVDDDTMKPKHAVHTCINLFNASTKLLKLGSHFQVQSWYQAQGVLVPCQSTFDLPLNAERVLSLESTWSLYPGADHAQRILILRVRNDDRRSRMIDWHRSI